MYPDKLFLAERSKSEVCKDVTKTIVGEDGPGLSI